MESLRIYIQSYGLEILVAAASLSLLSIFFVCLNYIRTTKLLRKYKRMMRGADNKNLEAMLYHHLDTLQSSLTRIKDIELSMRTLTTNIQSCLQHLSIVRYNAFEQMGGDQSFSIALLDQHGNGVVLTSLYGRSASTTFAKPVINHKSDYPLSNEEEQAIKSCMVSHT